MPEPTQEVKDVLYKKRFSRYMTSRDRPIIVGADGKRVCSWCGGNLKSQRFVHCCAECREEYEVRYGMAEGPVYRRDAGICAKCGLDTKVLAAVSTKCYHYRHGIEGFYEQWGPWASNLGKSVRWWQIDHIVPVIEGGGCCGLDNLQTLCIRCHKEDTAEIKARMAQRRKDAGISYKQISMSLDTEFIKQASSLALRQNRSLSSLLGEACYRFLNWQIMPDKDGEDTEDNEGIA